MAEILQFELVSPSALLTWEEADMVVVPGADGDFGVLLGHSPFITTLRPGVVDIHNDGTVSKSIFVEGGFAEVVNERCTLLASSAKDVSEFSQEDVNARLEAARARVVEADEPTKFAADHELNIAEAMRYAFESRSSHS